MKKLTYITVIRKIFITALLAAPGWILLDCAAMILSSVCYAFSTVVKQWLFDTITDVTVGNTSYQTLLFVTVCVVLFHIGNELLNAVCNFTWSPAMKATTISTYFKPSALKICSTPSLNPVWWWIRRALICSPMLLPPAKAAWLKPIARLLKHASTSLNR